MEFQEARRLYGHVMTRLLGAGWLRSVGFDRQSGPVLSWTESGAERASFLRDLVLKYGLNEYSMAPQLFTAACRGQVQDHSVPQIDPATRDFWLQCLQELPLEEHEEDLLGLVHLVVAWRPDMRLADDGLMA